MEEMTISKEVLQIINKSVEDAVQKATEKLTVRLSDDQERDFIESLISISLGRLVQIGTQIGTQTGIDIYKKEKEENIKQRFSRRLHNTRRLLQEYRKLKEHAVDAVYRKASTTDAIDILEGLENCTDDEIYIESIKNSIDKTSIILSHIEKMLEVYRMLCEKYQERFKEYHPRKYKAIYHYYISLHPVVSLIPHPIRPQYK
jgi:hypothetical protein